MGAWKSGAMEVWVRRGCTVVVAVVAAYASYQHQREFALRGGADPTSAGLWPLSVDGLLILASTGLLNHRGRRAGGRARWAMWLAFLLGIGVSLAANIAAAPVLAWQPVLVAGWPPISLLLAVELLARRPARGQQPDPGLGDAEAPMLTVVATGTDLDPAAMTSLSEKTAEGVMWNHFQRETALGNTPTGADLDRAAGTNNYGRAVLRRWRRAGRIPAVERERTGEIDGSARQYS